MTDPQERTRADSANFLEPGWARADSKLDVAHSAQHSLARSPGGFGAQRPALRDDVEGRANVREQSDEALVKRALAGERWAEDAIYRRHAPLITRLSSRLLRHKADADDVVQDTFLVAFDKLDKLRQPGALRAWLVRIAVHGSRRKLRKRKLLALCGLGEGEGAIALTSPAREHSRPDLHLELGAIERAVSYAPAEQRAAWLLHRVEALSIVETAESTSRSVATVKRYVAAVDALVERSVGGRHV